MHGIVLRNGFDCCVYCWHAFGAESEHSPPVGIGGDINYTYGPVVHAETGKEYEYVGETNPDDPIAHPDCFKEWAEAVNETDRSLWEYAETERTTE